MNVADLFVGSVSVILGTAGILVALANHDRHFRLAKIQWIERWGGRVLARGVYGFVGLLLIVLGAAIAGGWCS